jgi:hypothetical protein
MPLNTRQLVSSYEDSSSKPKLDVEAVETRSIRFSGLLALILGFVSILSILSYYLAFIPAAAVFFACVARRPFIGIEPEGFRSALYGFLLATFFLCWTLVENYCSHSALGRRGAEFAERWLRLIDQGDLEFVVELATHPTRRQATMMSLVDYYKSADGIKAVKNFRNNAVIDHLMSGAANRLWKAVKPPVVFNIGSRKMVTTFWRDESSPNAIIISVLMECIKSENPSATQWMVETVDKLSEGPAELPLITR